MQNHLDVSGTPHLKTLTSTGRDAGLAACETVSLHAALRTKVDRDDV